MNARVYECVCEYVYAYPFLLPHLCMNVCIYTHSHLYICTNTYRFIHIRIYIYSHMPNVHMYIHIRTRAQVHVHTQTGQHTSHFTLLRTRPYMCKPTCTSICICILIYMYMPVYSYMEWLRLVGSLKLSVSFAEHSLFYRALLHKKPIILRSLLIVATPYLLL